MNTEKTTVEDELIVDDTTAYDIYDVDTYTGEEYNYSDIKGLWDQYYKYADEEDSTTLYSTTGYDPAILKSDLMKLFGSEKALSSFLLTIASVMTIFGIISLVYGIYMCVVRFMIAKKMGRSTGFAVASIFFWPIMAGILAFSKNKATEVKTEAQAKSDAPTEDKTKDDTSSDSAK